MYIWDIIELDLKSDQNVGVARDNVITSYYACTYYSLYTVFCTKTCLWIHKHIIINLPIGKQRSQQRDYLCEMSDLNLHVRT